MQLYLLGCVPSTLKAGCLKDASLCEMLCVPSNQRLSQLQNVRRKKGVRALPPFFFERVENGLGTAAQSHDDPVEKALRGMRPSCRSPALLSLGAYLLLSEYALQPRFYALTQNFVCLTHFFVKLLINCQKFFV